MDGNDLARIDFCPDEACQLGPIRRRYLGVRLPREFHLDHRGHELGRRGRIEGLQGGRRAQGIPVGLVVEREIEALDRGAGEQRRQALADHGCERVGVVSHPPDDLVGVGDERGPAAGDPVVAAAAVDPVVARAAGDHVGPLASFDRVVAEAAKEPVGPRAATDHEIGKQRPLLQVARLDTPLAALDEVFGIGTHLVVTRADVDHEPLRAKGREEREILPVGRQIDAAGCRTLLRGERGGVGEAEKAGSGRLQHPERGAGGGLEDEFAGISPCGGELRGDEPTGRRTELRVDEFDQFGWGEIFCVRGHDLDRHRGVHARDVQGEGCVGHGVGERGVGRQGGSGDGGRQIRQ